MDPEPLEERGVGPPFGNPAPSEAALDGARPSFSPIAHLSPRVMEAKLGPPEGSGHLGAAFSAELEAEGLGL